MIDPNDSTWAAVKLFAQAQIQESTGALKARGLPWDDVLYHRGRVAALEDLLAQAPGAQPGADAAAGPPAY